MERKSDNIKLSIIVPVYNTGEFLRGCLDSILRQTLTEWELLLIDDGSTDHSGSICDEYAAIDHRIRVVHKENEGVSVARNTGLELAQGEFVAFVDSDDTIEPQMYRRMYDIACDHGVEIVMCDAVTVYPDREEADTITGLEQSCLVEQADWTPELLMEMAGSSCRCIYAYGLIQRHSVQFPVALKFSEDRIFNIYLMGYAQRLYYLKEPFYRRLIWEGSAVHRFHADYFETAKQAARGTELALELAWNNEERYQTAYLEHFVTASIAAINNYFYKTSPWTLKEKRRAVKQLCEDEMLQRALERNHCGGIRGRWIRKKQVSLLCVCAKYLNHKYKR